jgi:predicted dehydrogenase
MIHAAIVGLGRWGRNLVEAASGHGRLKIIRAVEPNVAGARDFCAVHQLDLIGDFDAILTDPAIDAVLLATPHSLHPAQVLACAAAHKQVFCEKPLALRRGDAVRMFDACREGGVPLAVGHNRRFWPSMRALREIVASGELGTILHIEGHNSNENSQNVTAGWRLSPEESPGGGLTGAGLHVLDAFVSMLGPIRQIYAQFTSRQPGPPPLDTTMMTMEFVSGVTGTMATVRATPLYWRVHVFGKRGSAEVLDEVTLVLRKTASKPETRTFSPVNVLRAELDAFVDMIEQTAAYPVPEADVLATLSAFEAGLRSIQLGIPVTCDVS